MCIRDSLKGFTAEQAAFNRLAPYLMTSVDTDPRKAAAERQALKSVLGEGDVYKRQAQAGVRPRELSRRAGAAGG